MLTGRSRRKRETPPRLFQRQHMIATSSLPLLNGFEPSMIVRVAFRSCLVFGTIAEQLLGRSWSWSR